MWPTCSTQILIFVLLCAASTYGEDADPFESDPSLDDPLFGLAEDDLPDDGLAHIQPQKPTTTRPVSEIFANRIKDAGYPAEVHTIQTNDGYILKMLCIPHGNKTSRSDIKKPRKPVFLMHPFLESSHAYIVQGPGKALAYLLADAGYDVWLGNGRGTEVSQQHAWLDAKNDAKYWDYSWQDIGQIDVAAFIDYVLAKTKFPKLTYVGFSQGTTAFLALTSTRPEYNKKIIQANLMAPVALLRGTGSKFYKAMSQYYSQLKAICSKMGFHKITVDNVDLLRKAEYFCKTMNPTDSTGCNYFTWFIGMDKVDPEILPALLAHVPAGVSLRQIMHFAQLIRSGKFLQFDYDNSFLNLLHYNQTSPPEFDLKQITTDINVYYSTGDTTTTAADVEQLLKMLPTVRSKYVISGFSHSDFVYNRMAADLVYRKVIANIGKAGKTISRKT